MAKADITIRVNVDFQEAEIEDLILIKRDLRDLDNGFQEIAQETPEYILDKLTEVSEAITSRVRVDLQRQLRTAKARRAALATADEKRKNLDDDIKRLEEKLG